MGRIKVLLIFSVILAVSLVFGFFLVENQHDILVDLLIYSEKVETSVGRFALSFFIAGMAVAFLLCVGLIFIQNMELRASRKEIRSLTKQLDKLRERSVKDAA